MVGPCLSEDVQAGLDAWPEHVVAAEYVLDVADVQEVVFLKRVQDVVINSCDTHEHITPEPFNSVFEKRGKRHL